MFLKVKKVDNMSSARYNPFRRIHPVDPKVELDRAIKKAKKTTVPKKVTDKIKKQKIIVVSKIELIKQHLAAKFSQYVKLFPNLNSIHPFYRAIIDVYSSIDELKKNLGRINGSIKIIKKMSDTYKATIRSIRKTRYLTESEIINHITRLWRQYIARIYSFISQIEDAFHYLNSLSLKLKKLPDYNPDYKTIVVCGPPNSGKSSLVGKISNANVQVASYPFTTKNLIFGHIELNTTPPIIIQIVDSPGLFDRPISDRKPEELLALEAIKTIADCIIFLFDCSYERTLEIQPQMRIFNNVLSFFSKKEKIVAINKIDIKDNIVCKKLITNLEELQIKPILLSVKNNINLDKLMDRIRQIFAG